MSGQPLLQLLANSGFSSYLVQTQQLIIHTYSTTFWYSSVVGLLLCVALVFLAPMLVTLLGVHEVVPVVRELAPAAFLVTLGSVPSTILRREMRFGEIAIHGIVASVIGQGFPIMVAIIGWGQFNATWWLKSIAPKRNWHIQEAL
jgi:O-antigen/teichoic acid export membrane protein